MIILIQNILKKLLPIVKTVKKIGMSANIFVIMDESIFFVARCFGESGYSRYVEKFGENLRFNFGLEGSREGQLRKRRMVDPHWQTDL